MENQRAGQEDVQEKLAEIRAMLSMRGAFNSSELFDEFVREHEWGLALHVVCDYLLEPTAQAAPEAVIQQIQSLHESMGINDTCVAHLRAKAQQHVGD